MICFSWLGFPQYAARCIRAVVEAIDEKVCVVATHPAVPVKGMEEIANCQVIWVTEEEKRSLAELVGEMPRVFFACGWGSRLVNRWRDEVRRAGMTVVATCDNNFVLGWRLFLQAIRFRVFIRNKYDAFWVPGGSGKRLMRFLGVESQKVYTGLYSADNELFVDMVPLASRKRQILFVGQFCERKNVMALCQAFLLIAPEIRTGWSLELCGNGPLRKYLPNDPAVIIHDFVQPEDLAKIYQQTRIFVLPSKVEHWGLVVHEAALSGCYLILGAEVGASEDFLHKGINGDSVNPNDVEDISSKLRSAISMSSKEFAIAEETSLKLSKNVTPAHFVRSVKKMAYGNKG